VGSGEELRPETDVFFVKFELKNASDDKDFDNLSKKSLMLKMLAMCRSGAPLQSGPT